jgi:hypothetical protein
MNAVSRQTKRSSRTRDAAKCVDQTILKAKNTTEAYFEAQIMPRFADGRMLSNVPTAFECFDSDGKKLVRRKKRFRWPSSHSGVATRNQALLRLNHYHAQTRRVIVNITGNRDLWYLKRNYQNNSVGTRHTIVLIFAAMHRLSELARYDPAGLDKHLSGQANWLLSEFIQGSLDQFVDQIASEITGRQFWPPKVR